MSDFDRIRETHAPLVWSVVARILKHQEDALECFQEVFAEALVRSRQAEVLDWGALLRWLATRRAIDLLRRRRTRATVSLANEPVSNDADAAERQATFKELVERVRGEMANLPVRQAEAFWLACVENRSYEEVAEQMGIERNAVGVLVHRARRHMRSKLKSFNTTPRD